MSDHSEHEIRTKNAWVSAMLADVCVSVRNIAFRKSDGYVAYDAKTDKGIELFDEQAIAKIDELVKQRQELGREITRRLQEHGFSSSDNSPTKVG